MVKPEDFGAIGDDVANDTTAVQAAYATGESVNLSGIYRINQRPVISEGQMTVGEGWNTGFNWKGSGHLFDFKNNTIFKTFSVRGDGSNKAFFVNSKTEYSILKELNLHNFDYAIDTVNTFLVRSNKWIGASITDCFIHDNNIGVNFGSRSEYNTASNNTLVRNNVAIQNIGGNNKIVLNTITGNQVALAVLGGDNDGHGLITNNSINHNVTALNCDEVKLGMLVQSNNIYGNREIRLRDTARMKINNNDISSTKFVAEGVNEELKIQHNDLFKFVTIPEDLANVDVLAGNYGESSRKSRYLQVNPTLKKVMNLFSDKKILRFNGDPLEENRFLGINQDIGRFSGKFGEFEITYKLNELVSGARSLVNFGAIPPTGNHGGANTWQIFFRGGSNAGKLQFRFYDNSNSVIIANTTNSYNNLNQRNIKMRYDSVNDNIVINIDNGNEVINVDVSSNTFDRANNLSENVRFQLFKEISGVQSGSQLKLDLIKLRVGAYELNQNWQYADRTLFLNGNQFATVEGSELILN